MSGQTVVRHCLLALALGLLLASCSPLVDSQQEDDNPVIREAVARKEASPREAARILEKALEANPQLARAHWELGLICLEKTSNYAAAVYHFQKVLEMRPDWKFANTAKQLINNSKIELVKEGVEAPMLPSAQQIIDRYVRDIHDKHTIITNLQVRLQSLTVVTQQLSAENAQLRQQLQVAVAQAQPRQSPAVQEPAPPGRSPLPQPDGSTTAQSQQRPPQPQAQAGNSKSRVAGASASPPGRSPLPESGGSAKARSQQRPPQPQAQAGSSKTRVAGASASPPSQSRRTTDTRFSPPTAGARTYTLRQGESLFGVANRNGCTVDQIIALNPGLSRSRVQPGQTIRLPGR